MFKKHILLDSPVFHTDALVEAVHVPSTLRMRPAPLPPRSQGRPLGGRFLTRATFLLAAAPSPRVLRAQASQALLSAWWRSPARCPPRPRAAQPQARWAFTSLPLGRPTGTHRPTARRPSRDGRALGSRPLRRRCSDGRAVRTARPSACARGGAARTAFGASGNSGVGFTGGGGCLTRTPQKPEGPGQPLPTGTRQHVDLPGRNG